VLLGLTRGGLSRTRAHASLTIVCVEAHPYACRAHIDHNLGRQLHDAPSERSPLDGTGEPIPDDLLPESG